MFNASLIKLWVLFSDLLHGKIIYVFLFFAFLFLLKILLGREDGFFSYRILHSPFDKSLFSVILGVIV